MDIPSSLALNYLKKASKIGFTLHSAGFITIVDSVLVAMALLALGIVGKIHSDVTCTNFSPLHVPESKTWVAGIDTLHKAEEVAAEPKPLGYCPSQSHALVTTRMITTDSFGTIIHHYADNVDIVEPFE